MSKPPSLSRDETQQHLFPAGPPTLWCPPLTHYAQDGQIDQERLAAHFHFMQPWVKGFLVPGTTGDGWELFPAEKAALLDAVLRNVRGSDAQVLLGALDPDASAAKRIIQAGWHHLETRQAGDTPLATLRKNQVCGFAICPPRGAQLSQEEIGQGLSAVLDLGLPTALYQLPQVTQNEMSPPLVADLARRFAHFILFKDTSGADRVATAKLDLGGVFLVRGMERDYASSLKVGGGPYDGYLLSTANSFAAPLSKIRELLAVERREEANLLSERLSSVVDELFNIADAVAHGNKFTNANKLADHFYAHGPGAASLAPPRLHSGSWLTVEMVRAAGDSLRRHGFMPARGYLE